MKRLRHYNKGTAIVLSCFGSVVEQKRYQALLDDVQKRYPNCDVRMALSSRMVLKRLAAKGEHYQHLPSALATLDMEGYQRILVVSCYLFPTDEHKQVEMITEGFRQFSLSNIEHTPAIVHHTHRANDLLSSLNTQFSEDSDINLFVHHGAPYLDNPGHQAINYCDTLLSQLSPKNVSCSLEGAMPFELVKSAIQSRVKELDKTEKPRLRVIPMLLVSGNHFLNDIASITCQLLDLCDVEVAAGEDGESFNLLSQQAVMDIIYTQIEQGLVRLKTPADEASNMISKEAVNG